MHFSNSFNHKEGLLNMKRDHKRNAVMNTTKTVIVTKTFRTFNICISMFFFVLFPLRNIDERHKLVLEQL